MLPSACAMLYCVLDTQLLIWLLCVAHKEPGPKYYILYREEIVHFTAVSLSQSVERRVIGLMKKELDMMWEEAVVALGRDVNPGQYEYKVVALFEY